MMPCSLWILVGRIVPLGKVDRISLIGCDCKSELLLLSVFIVEELVVILL